MTLLILGLILWIIVHFFKRVAPDLRQELQDKMGDASKGVIALLLLFAIVLMVIGYRGADGSVYWGTSGVATGINNLLMLLAVALFGVGSSQSRARAIFRHPMLVGVVVWAFSHLLVNGDMPSFVLFGGLAIWATAEMAVINHADRDYTPHESGTVAGDIRLAIITLIVFAVISVVHIWLGYNPFGA